MSGVRPAETSPSAVFRTDLPCALEQVRPAASRAVAFLTAQGCAPDDLSACELALVEACNNAVRYAPPERRDQPILIEALCEPAAIELRVTDHTSGFNWPEHVDLPAKESEGGRGLYLIRTLMQRASYFQGKGENILVMRRLRQAGGAAPFVQTDLPSNPADFHRSLTENEQVIGQMVEELSSCYESLSAIFRFGAEQVPAGQLTDFARRLLGDMLRILEADWFVVRIVPDGESRLSVFVASEPALELEPLFLPEQRRDADSVEAIAAVSGQDVWFDQRQPLTSADPLGRVKRGAAGLAHPLFLGGKLVGTLAVGVNQPRALAPGESARVAFSAGQTSVVTTFGDFLAIQIVNARFQEQLVKSRVLARELEIARTIQRSLLPQTLPQVPGLSLAAHCESAHNVGGDYYDVLQLGERQLLLVVADVMGKGVPAAMFAAILRTLVRAAPDQAADPAGLLSRLNRILFHDLSGVDMFITVQFAMVDVAQRRLVVAGAGHCPLLLAIPGGVPARAVAPEGMPLGILQDTTYANVSLEFPAGAKALLYTDGLTEAASASGERYGQERLAQWCQSQAAHAPSAEELRTALLAELVRFRDATTLNDDLTFVIIAA